MVKRKGERQMKTKEENLLKTFDLWSIWYAFVIGMAVGIAITTLSLM
jgi:hypothetical protein